MFHEYQGAERWTARVILEHTGPVIEWMLEVLDNLEETC